MAKPLFTFLSLRVLRSVASSPSVMVASCALSLPISCWLAFIMSFAMPEMSRCLFCVARCYLRCV